MRVLTCRGIGEPVGGHTMLSGFVNALPGEVTHVEVPYPASYGFVNATRDPLGESFDESLGALYTALRAEIERSDEPTIIAGYSAGAAGAGNYVAANPLPDHVKAVILVADPLRPGGSIYGIAGSRPVNIDVPVIWVSNPADVICSCPRNSLLRIIADLTPRMSLGDPQAWSEDVLSTFTSPRKRNRLVRLAGLSWWEPMATLRHLRTAEHEAMGYLGVGQPSTHTVYDKVRPGSDRTWLQEAADTVVAKLGM